MRKTTVLLFLLFTMLFSFAVSAAPSNAAKWYQIELIIFSNITQQGLKSEQWPWVYPNYRAKPRTITLNAGLTPLSYKDFVMKQEESRIKKRPQYQIVMHLAWRQAVRHPRFAKTLHIFGGKVYDPSGKQIATDFNGKLPYQNKVIWQVNGTVTVSVLRYLDLKLNLLFAAPTSELSRSFRNGDVSNVQGRFAYFQLQQNRRMRSKELNYIGHPLYGVLVKIIPLQ